MVRPEDCDCILRLVWRREGPPGLQTKYITCAAPAHRQSHRAQRRQLQSDCPQRNKKKTSHFPSPQILMLHIETKQTTMKTEDRPTDSKHGVRTGAHVKKKTTKGNVEPRPRL